ncbi:sensor histidine kinase [Actinobacteria bacterium YIM 96077]|uniref:histidine kinase n=1 Tax=Phytoactinopolyspora halophila TaxID=1981511 RepID=A0A329QIW7_9ACTN|nr:histidine kinase [Phytoactinopolyspora halophila]AYY13557.1 sensor histidine kinase [Actinobacteria bacterium YIM 96077]RAW12387.1 sensor histidine kinase [Phytoactinopolyspora halophila]
MSVDSPIPGWIRRVWGWYVVRQHRLADWILAVVAYVPVVIFTVIPGAYQDDEPSSTPSLAFRLVPEALPDDPEPDLAQLLGDPMTAPFAATVIVVAPGLTVWGIMYRRTRPRRLLTVATALLLLLGNIVPIALALYTYAAWFTDRRRLVAWSVAAVAALVVGFWFDSTTVVLAPVAIGIPLTLGLWIGTRRQLVANLRERAARLEREQQLMAERAAAAERTRIAGEMHDVVAHRVSLMVVHAGGLEVNAAEPDVAATAGQIRQTGRDALSELREVLGILRDASDGNAEAPTAPQPVIADLEHLVAGWRSAGMRVDYERAGEERAFPVQVERTAYRVVQEGLTNAAKHAAGASVRVRLDYGRDQLGVTVVNGPPPRGSEPAGEEDGERRRVPAGPAHPPGMPLTSGGYGLAGLRERTALAGGELTAGPLGDGSWQIRATLREVA